tara:strand:+ start:2411 stop:3760 length:1350 start_codon:yes stop_codon:yes gene_type:complete
MGWFGFGKSKKKSKDANTNSSSSNYSSDNYLQASGIGSQIANDQIDTLIANKDNLQNQAGTVNVNPKFNDFLERNKRDDGSYNSAAQAIINQYDTGTNAYQQEMQKIINSSPSAAQAYKKRFPISSGIAKLAGAATNLIPGVGMAKGILKVLGNFGKGTKNIFNQAKTGITSSGAYNDFKDLITKDEKPPTDMGTRKSNIDYDDASNPRGINMADISGPSTSTDIIEIKDNKVKTKDNIDKVNNAQKTLTEALDVQNFKRTLDNPSAIETLPVNFKSTLDKLLQNNQLNSSEILRSQQLLRDFSTPSTVGPVTNGYNNSGITNTLPTNQIAGGFGTGLEYLLNNEAIEKRSGSKGVNLNTLGKIQEGIGTIDNNLNKFNIDLNNIGLNNNFGQGLTSGYNAIKSTQDGKGFDVDINNRRLEYNKDFLNGKINTYIDPENVGIGWSTSIG